MSLTDLLALAFAVGAANNAWHYGSLFASWQQLLEMKVTGELDDPVEPVIIELPKDIEAAPFPKWQITVVRNCPELLAKLLYCPFCLRYHLSYLFLLLFLCATGQSQTWGAFLIYSLAITGLSAAVTEHEKKAHV